MANTQDIRRRIKSIRNTSQITKALQMVAASKMRKAQMSAVAGRPYSNLMNRVLVSLQQRTDSKLHPLLQVRQVKKELVVILSTDKGLAGPLNTNLFREAIKFEADKTIYVTSGAKARQFIVRTRRELLEMRVVDEREPERRGQHPPRQRGERRAPDATAAGGAVPPFRHPGVFYAGAFGPARRGGDVSSHRDAVGRVDPVERPP